MGRLPKHYQTVANLASGIAIAQSVAVAVVAVVLVVLSASCLNSGATFTADSYFLRLIKEQYFQNADCSVFTDVQKDLLPASQVFIWLIVILSISVIWLVASITLVIVTDEIAATYFPSVAYVWSAATVAAAAADVALGTMFGLDFATLHAELRKHTIEEPETYKLDVLRYGAFLLMTLSLKGFVMIVVNVAFAVALIIIASSARTILDKSQHSVHTRGALSAYESNKVTADMWQNQQAFDHPLANTRGNVNRAFSDTEEDMTLASQNDFAMSRSFDRSDSWHHTRNHAEPPRQFPYYDEGRSPKAPQPPTVPSSAILPPWRRDPWEQQPAVPAPDYSPVNGRHLKSALKPAM